MAIIVKNLINKAEEKKAETNSQPVQTTEHHEHTIKYDHDVLIVDGKPKKISKKSAYLLDMITSDSE